MLSALLTAEIDSSSHSDFYRQYLIGCTLMSFSAC